MYLIFLYLVRALESDVTRSCILYPYGVVSLVTIWRLLYETCMYTLVGWWMDTDSFISSALLVPVESIVR